MFRDSDRETMSTRTKKKKFILRKFHIALNKQSIYKYL